jgi:hypothetical protein
MTRKSLSVVVAALAIAAAISIPGWPGEAFSDAELGYAIEAPSGWILSRPDAYSVRFAGPAGAHLEIQNVLTSAHGGNYEDVDALAANLKCQLASGSDSISIYGAGDFDVYDADGMHLTARQFLTDYTYAGISVREWYGVVARAAGDIFYVLSYTASTEAYSAYEPDVIAALRTWTVSGATGTTEAETTESSLGTADIYVVLEDSGHIGPYHYAESAYDKRYYEFTVSASGYVALCVVDQAGEAITGWIFAADGTEITTKPGNYADVYTSSYPVGPGTYTVKVGQDNMVTESDFLMQVYFSLAPFTIDDLAARFGARVRILP